MFNWMDNNLSRHTNNRVDTVMLLLVAVLCLFGLLMITSASMDLAQDWYGNSFYFLQRQFIYLLLAIVAGFAIYLVRCEVLLSCGLPLMIATFFLLVLVLVDGAEVNGSKRWLNIAGFSVQPSEFAKLTCIIFVANYIARHKRELKHNLFGLCKPIFVTLVIFALILMEPDYGTAVITLAVVTTMLFLAGTNAWWFALYMFLCVVTLPLLIIFEPYRWERLKAFLDPWQDPYDGGYQLIQSWIAVANGSWFGRGLGDSISKYFYLPEAHTDFIVAVIAEELGFIAVLLLVLVYLAITWRCFTIGRRSEEQEQIANAHLAYGIGAWIGLQAFINIAVVMGMLPTKGIPLPLISVGGSSLLVTFIAIAIVQRVYYEACTTDQLIQRQHHRELKNA